MFLRSKSRFKNGKTHQYWSIVENRRLANGKSAQRHLLYLGEINGSQEAQWTKTISVFSGDDKKEKQIALFPENRPVPVLDCDVVQLRLSEMTLRRPRQWGACWLTLELWNQLLLDDFWAPRLPTSRKGTNWLNVLKVQVAHQLISPGSEWRLHRQWYDQSALGDLLCEDFGVAADDTLYRSLDKLLSHKQDLFLFLKQRWEDLFNARFDILLYDLTSTYFECDPPGTGKRKFGYSRDKRSDCVQVVIALIVTPEGFPLTYEVLAGNTLDKTTLEDFLKKIENLYGQAERVWVMDRGIPTEPVLEKMRNATPQIRYLVGTPKGRLTKLEERFLNQPWQSVRPEVSVKLTTENGELYVLARSEGRTNKERAMRSRKLRRLWERLKELQKQELSRDQLLLKLGAAKKEAGRAWGLIKIKVPQKDEPVNTTTFSFSFDKKKIKIARRREGSYLLRSNISDEDPIKLWQYYIQLTEIEQAFKELKNDLMIRPINHQREDRIESHIFVAFLSYCLQVTLKNRLKALAPGLTPRAVLEKFAAMQMIDVHLPTTDNKHLVLSRYTEPENDQIMLLQELHLKLPAQPPPKIYSQVSAA